MHETHAEADKALSAHKRKYLENGNTRVIETNLFRKCRDGHFDPLVKLISGMSLLFLDGVDNVRVWAAFPFVQNIDLEEGWRKQSDKRKTLSHF